MTMHTPLCAWMHGCMDAWMHGCMDAWMHGCMDACMQRRLCSPNKAPAGQWYLDRNSALQWENDIFMILGTKSCPSDQIGQPGHLASTCVHHNIGNELTVEVN